MSAPVETIPVIDLAPYLAGAPEALDRTADQLRLALTEIGFYFIVNHGVSEAEVRDIYRQANGWHRGSAGPPARRDDRAATRGRRTALH